MSKKKFNQDEFGWTLSALRNDLNNSNELKSKELGREKEIAEKQLEMKKLRKIEFRGKDQTGTMNHSWFYGSLDLCYNPDFPRIICKDRFGNNMYVQVDKETVGQFTELFDRNGKKIYEGDIVGLFCNTQIFEVKWCNVRGGYFLDDVIMSGGSEPSTECLGNLTDTIEVIGNIYDNKDLLE